MNVEEFLAAIPSFAPGDFRAVFSALKEKIGEQKAMAYLQIANAGNNSHPLADSLEEAPNNREVPRLLRAGEFLQQVGTPLPMLVDQLIPEKSLVLLSGKPKVGKSLAALNILNAICTRRLVFGQFAVNRSGPVCYFGMEDGAHEIANRLLKLGIKPGDSRPLVVCAERFVLHTKEAVSSLKHMIAEIDPVLIVIDTAREALPIRDWNDASEVTDKIRAVREFAREHCSVLLLTHNRKSAGDDAGDEIAGSNALTGGVDGWLSIVNSEKRLDSNRLTLNVDGRGGMRGRFTIELDKETLSYRVISDTDLAAEKANTDEATTVEELRHFGDAFMVFGGHATIRQIVDYLAGEAVKPSSREYKTVQRAVQEMEKYKLVKGTEEKQKGVGAGKPPLIYALTDRAYQIWNYRQFSQDSRESDELSIIPRLSDLVQCDDLSGLSAEREAFML